MLGSTTFIKKLITQRVFIGIFDKEKKEVKFIESRGVFLMQQSIKNIQVVFLKMFGIDRVRMILLQVLLQIPNHLDKWEEI